MVTIENGKPVHRKSDRIYAFVITTVVISLLILTLSLLSSSVLRGITQIVNTSGRIRGGMQLTISSALMGEDDAKNIAYVHKQFDELVAFEQKHTLFFSEVDLQLIRNLHDKWVDTIPKILSNPNDDQLKLAKDSLWADADFLVTTISGKSTQFRKIQSTTSVLLIIAVFIELILLIRLKIVFIKGLMNSTLRDPLTGLLNRTYLLQYIEDFCRTVMNLPEKMFRVFILADIDHFKRVNDTYGHQMGDEVLVSISKAIKVNTRDNDLTFRYGGEEFLIIGAFKTIRDAVSFTERLRIAVAKESTGNLSVSMSFGMGFCEGKMDFYSIMNDADTALYAAKDHGRNCTYIQLKGGKLLSAQEFLAAEVSDYLI